MVRDWKLVLSEVEGLELGAWLIGSLAIGSFCVAGFPEPSDHLRHRFFAIVQTQDAEMILGGISSDRRVARESNRIIVETPKNRSAHLIVFENLHNRVIVNDLIVLGEFAFRGRPAGRQTEFLQQDRFPRLSFVEFDQTVEPVNRVVVVKAPEIEILVERGQIFSTRAIDPADSLQRIGIERADELGDALEKCDDHTIADGTDCFVRLVLQVPAHDARIARECRDERAQICFDHSEIGWLIQSKIETVQQCQNHFEVQASGDVQKRAHVRDILRVRYRRVGIERCRRGRAGEGVVEINEDAHDVRPERYARTQFAFGYLRFPFAHVEHTPGMQLRVIVEAANREAFAAQIKLIAAHRHEINRARCGGGSRRGGGRRRECRRPSWSEGRSCRRRCGGGGLRRCGGSG